MPFLRVSVAFYYTVNMILEIIKKANPFPYTAKFMFVGVRNNKTEQIKTLKDKKNMYIVLYYIKKYLTRLGEMIIFLPRLENYQFSQSG